MSKRTKKILKIISNTLVIVVVFVAFLLHGFQLFGLTPYSVLSGSMESVYPTGSLIYVSKTEPEKLEVNDIITFRLSNGAVATHRIIELVEDEKDPSITRFRTKGDENNIADGSLVSFDSVIGTPVFCIPSLGYFASYIAVPPGKFIVLCFSLAVILFEIIVSIITDDKSDEKDKVQNGKSDADDNESVERNDE